MNVLERLRGRLIVSVQAEAGSLLGAPGTIALLAQVAAGNGAAGVRIEGAQSIAAVRAALPEIPIVGIVKRRHAGFDPYITSTAEEIAQVAVAGATIVAFDATARARFGGASVPQLIERSQTLGVIPMADCSTGQEALAAAAAGAEIVATTLAGYTDATRGRRLPALDIIEELRAAHPFVVCEGGITTPDDARAAFAAGASAIVVGTAITNVDALVRRFVAAAPTGL